MPLGHVTETTGHDAEFGGHVAEKVGHARPKYALGGYASVLPPLRYRDLPHLLSVLADEVIAPAERRIAEIEARRAAFEAALARR